MATESKIGAQIEAYCSKCKLDTIHFITAIEGTLVSKVMCDVCSSYHKYRSPKSGDVAKSSKSKVKSASTEKKAPKTRRTRSTKIDWPASIDKMDTDTAVAYNLTDTYEDVDLIDHKTFGLGIIRKVHSDTKIEVLFEEGLKMLVQNWREQ